MTQLLYMLFGMVIILFVLAILFAVLPDKKEKKEDKKTPIRIELQIKYEGYLYTLYNDGTWDVHTIC